MVRVGTVVRTLILCGLALTTLAFAKTDKSKTIVTYPSAFAVSQRLSDLPIDESMFATREMPEPRPVPLRKNAVAGPVGQEDPMLQKEVLPQVSATQGIVFDGVDEALRVPQTELRLFGKPESFVKRRMGVALAHDADVEIARERAKEAAGRVTVRQGK